jgi:hypothetical protein
MIKARRAFTLLEVLLAGGILFVVSSAIVSLSNSIIQGTVVSSDLTITNRWAAEGIELVTKIRDDNSKIWGFSQGVHYWLHVPNLTSDNYGWHYLVANADGRTWKLEPLPAQYKNVLDYKAAAFNPELLTRDKLQAENISGYRFICIEAVGAVRAANPDTSKLHCNTNGNDRETRTITDGPRNPAATACYQEPPTTSQLRVDRYCLLTQPSLNRAGLGAGGPKLILDGNAVKVRSVVLWNDRGEYRLTDIATMLTNWRSVGDL